MKQSKLTSLDWAVIGVGFTGHPSYRGNLNVAEWLWMEEFAGIALCFPKDPRFDRVHDTCVMYCDL